MLPHELIHGHAVQLLLLAPLGQREAIPAGNVGLNANLLVKNLLSQEDEVGISETERWSHICLCDMSSGKPRNYCGSFPSFPMSLPRSHASNTEIQDSYVFFSMKTRGNLLIELSPTK
jgi:hypothetical protein